MLTLTTLKARDAARAAYDTALAAFMACDGTMSEAVFFARAAQMNATRAWDTAAEILAAPMHPLRRAAVESFTLAEVNAAMQAAADAEIMAASSCPNIDSLERSAFKASEACINIRLSPNRPQWSLK